MPFDQAAYVKASALVVETTLSGGLRRSYPELSDLERSQMLIEILDYISRWHGFEVRQVPAMEEADGE